MSRRKLGRSQFQGILLIVAGSAAYLYQGCAEADTKMSDIVLVSRNGGKLLSAAMA